MDPVSLNITRKIEDAIILHLLLVGVLRLLWIAYKLLADQCGEEHGGPGAVIFWGAMKAIVVYGGKALAAAGNNAATS